jgi:agmatinase
MSLKDFDPNSAGSGGGIFGLPHTLAESKVALLSVPFEATTSYLGGTSKAATKIFQASQQVDLFHPLYPTACRDGIHLASLSTSKKIFEWSKKAQSLAKKSRNLKPGKAKEKLIDQVNDLSAKVNDWVAKETHKLQSQKKIVGIIGGDHSVPFAAIAETLRRHPKMGILHLDAHFDLRRAYEGFTWSHASIFYNVITRLPLQRLVQIGIRDYCDEELQFARAKAPIKFFTDSEIFGHRARGQTWDRLCDQILESLPTEVYLSFDIDGLDPKLCPATGTPVPGGFDFNEIVYLLQRLVASKRKIVGFDLCEVGPEEWDANVGARLLYQMCLSAIESHRS